MYTSSVISIAVILNVFFSSAWALPRPQGDDGSLPGELIGDLRFGQTTPVGKSIANILLGTESAQTDVKGTRPAGDCKKSTDPCCVWYDVAADLTKSFLGPTGRCNDLARAAIRMGFHDAGTWSKKLAAAGQDYGGADGSLVLFNEITRSENRGLELIVALAKLYQAKHNIGMADLIQFASNHATVTCPLGPRVRTFVGRKDATKAAPNGLLPSVSSNADVLIALFQDKTIGAHELTALVGAHSSSKQFAQSLLRFAAPQDTTPGIWDVSFYNETIQPKPDPRVFRFASDAVLAADSRCSGEWRSFIGDQAHWNMDYAAAYVRLSLLGVNNINNLTECSATLPAARKSFNGATEPGLDQ